MKASGGGEREGAWKGLERTGRGAKRLIMDMQIWRWTRPLRVALPPDFGLAPSFSSSTCVVSEFDPTALPIRVSQGRVLRAVAAPAQPTISGVVVDGAPPLHRRSALRYWRIPRGKDKAIDKGCPK